MPRRFAEGTCSVLGLFSETEYLALSEGLGPDEIESALLSCPDCARDWEGFSANKRTDTGWYFQRIENGKYQVGFLDDGKITSTEVYDEEVKGCSSYILHEVSTWATSVRG